MELAKAGEKIPSEHFLNTHLFYGAKEMELTHLDQIFDNPMYDCEYIG